MARACSRCFPEDSAPHAVWPSRRSQMGQLDSGSRRSPTNDPVRGRSNSTLWSHATLVASTAPTSAGHPCLTSRG